MEVQTSHQLESLLVFKTTHNLVVTDVELLQVVKLSYRCWQSS